MTKRLYRSRKDKVLGGVAGGLGEYFQVDPVFLRILFVVFTFVGGAGLISYILCWFIIPEKPHEGTADSTEAPAAEAPSAEGETPRVEKKRRGSLLFGVILIVAGLLFFANNFLPSFYFEDYWPIILIAIGCVLLWKAFQRSAEKE